MKKLFFIFSFFHLFIFLSCNGQANKSTEVADVAAPSRDEYPMPVIPAAMTDPEQQMRWVADHFWDGYDFNDVDALHDEEYTKTAWANYNMLLLNIPRQIGNPSVATLFEKASVNKEAYLTFAEIAEEYLHDPNSPMRDEEYFIVVLETILGGTVLDEYERIRPQSLLTLARKNRVGTRAADFKYTEMRGDTGTLYGLRSQWVLLFFNNPGCPACAESVGQIMASPLLTDMMGDGRLEVLAVYPDEDLAAWRDHAGDIPPIWINARASGLMETGAEVYDLKAIPSIYLLDARKTVVLKDVMGVHLIEQALSNGDN